MSTFALMAVISANTVAKRDNIFDYIQTFLSGKPVWGNTDMSKGTNSVTSWPNITVTVRFTQRPHLDDLFQKAKGKINTMTGVKITVSKHVCSHSEGVPSPCVFEEVYSIER
jgi:hypothetical protein